MPLRFVRLIIEKFKAIDSEFDVKTMQSERLRLTVLAIFFGALFILFVILILVFPEQLHRFHRNISIKYWIMFFYFLITGYELWIRYIMGIFIEKKRHFPNALRYMNALVETSYPTILMLILACYITPSDVLLLPPPFLYYLFIILAALRLDFKLCLFTGMVAATEYTLLAYFFIHYSAGAFSDLTVTYFPHLVKGGALLLGGLVTGLITLLIKRTMMEVLSSIEERNQIYNIFGQHVSPAVVDKLLQQKTELLSETRCVSVMFLDIRNFSKFSEDKKPTEVVDYLNYLFDFMIDIINDHQGIINKFLGDGFMAVFGAPLSDGEDNRHAVEASQHIITRVSQEVHSGNIPATRIGIGIHAGEVVTGNIGSTLRKEYTVIGDVVNVAARIEQLNKKFDSQILISEDVTEGLQESKSHPMKSLGEVNVRGRSSAVHIYQLM
ncbi:adenylate/guanylate cyclase domain-containing protein [candidate division CSSED10-310 bacterium]|uniref:Adenylate/guanylate cyclase domain-containing protein n=1 Tax=candidate division CSSED10-310 bacterium TaxID=2855610 RepID=A0ABV6YYY9_UNCC1